MPKKKPNAEALETLQSFCLMDDFFMRSALEDIDAVECVVRVILGRDDISIISCTPQYGVQNLYGHSVEFDIMAVDKDRVYYDIEIQKVKSTGLAKRAAFYSSLLNSMTLEKNTDYKTRCNSYTIFIMDGDPFGKGIPLYHAAIKIDELDNQRLDDGAEIIFVNGAYKGTDSVGHLVQDFSETKASKMFYKQLSNRVRYLKESEEGVTIMCEKMERFAEKRVSTIVINMIHDGSSDEKIHQITGAPLDTIQQLRAEAAARHE